jgi:hypothetical protein
MPEPPDPESLARRFLDLWQDQLTAVAGDPQLAETMTRWIGMTAPGMAAFLPLMQAGLKAASAKEGPSDAQGRASDGKTPAGTAAAAAAHGGGGGDVDKLARRLADVEKRLARLEAGTGGKREGAAEKPGGDRPGGG